MIKFMVMSLMALMLSGCFDDGIEKCDSKDVKEVTKEILMDNGIRGLIETQARKSVDIKSVDLLAQKALKTARYDLIKQTIEEFIDGENKRIAQENKKIEADNRYGEIKKPLIEVIDVTPILDDLKKYKDIINNFEPINENDSFKKYFEANILSKSPSFALAIGEINCPFPNKTDQNKLDWGNRVVFPSYRLFGEQSFVESLTNAKVKELSKNEVERITKTLDIVNIRETSLDQKSKTRQCEANLKLNEQVGKVFKIQIRKLDDGGFRVEVKL